MAVAVSALLVAAQQAGAAAPASVGPSAANTVPQDLETVTVYARRLVPVTRVAAMVSVIPQETIERTLVSDVKQLVRYEPGLSVRSDPFRFGADTIAVRGVGGNRVAVEVDGIPAAGGFAVGSFADSGRAFVDPAFLERVEVLRGPASSLYGSDAIGGVVAMTTIAPRALLDDGRDYGLRVSSGYTGVDEGWNAAAIGGARRGATSALLGYVRREGSAPDTAADVTPNPRDYRSDSLLAKVEFGAMPGGPVLLIAEAARVQQQTSVDAWLGLAGSRFVNTTLLEGDDEQERQRVGVSQRLGATHAFDSADWRVYLQGTDTRQDTDEQRRAVPPRTPPVAISRGFRLEDQTVGVEFTAVRAFAADRASHTVVYGFEAADSRNEERRDGRQTDLNSGNVTNVILGESFPLRDFPITDVTRVGAFVQDEWVPGASRWTLIPALRVDYYRLDPRADAMYRADNPSIAPVGLDDTAFAPKLGVTRDLGNGLTAFAQYAHGFRAPPPEDLNIGLELPLLNIKAIPNPDLQPETSDGYELGFRWSGAAGGFAASAYYTDYQDFIESKVNLGRDPVTGVTLFQSQNVAEARIYGAELTANTQFGDRWPRLEGWSGRLSAAWSVGEDRVNDEPLNSVDPASAIVAIGYEAVSGQWGGELVTTTVATKSAVDDSRANLYETDGYVTLDLLARYDFGNGVRLNAGLFNLTDADYIEWADVRGRTVGDPLIPYYTRPGRSFSVTLHWRL
ncbi:MAG: TonB-dependent hemoglobin/transferrin/lactoferrin family receptor [Steroidobacteraceae bacterium]|nr:TonB-dependent hemoglobin/transferrin/lactoferrin family receptor [Steroidobacteraceae bacterium]